MRTNKESKTTTTKKEKNKDKDWITCRIHTHMEKLQKKMSSTTVTIHQQQTEWKKTSTQCIHLHSLITDLNA